MDSITHTVLGACVGEAIAGRKLGKKAMLWGALANNLPDIDVITSWWMNQPANLLAHRGFTHSILFVLLAAPLVGWVMRKIYHKNNFTWREWTILFGANMFIHIIIDAFTAYGTGWFEPFSHTRVSFNLLFVADPFFTLPLIIVSIALLILPGSSSKRFAWRTTGLIISSLYLVYALYVKIQVDQVAKKALDKEKMDTRNFIATPTPLNNFLWYVIASNEAGCNVGYYSVFDRTEEIDFYFIPRNDSLLGEIKDNDDVKNLIRFSQGYYHVGKFNDSLVFNDLRFGQIGGWVTGDAPFVFQYILSKDAENAMAIQSGRMRASGRIAFTQMIERIKGK